MGPRIRTAYVKRLDRLYSRTYTSTVKREDWSTARSTMTSRHKIRRKTRPLSELALQNLTLYTQTKTTARRVEVSIATLLMMKERIQRDQRGGQYTRQPELSSQRMQVSKTEAAVIEIATKMLEEKGHALGLSSPLSFNPADPPEFLVASVLLRLYSPSTRIG